MAPLVLAVLAASVPEHGIERHVRAAESKGRGARRRAGPAALPDIFSDAFTRFTDGHAGQERNRALTRGDRAKVMTTAKGEHDPNEVRIRDNTRQHIDLSSQPQLALSVGRARYPTDKPN